MCIRYRSFRYCLGNRYGGIDALSFRVLVDDGKACRTLLFRVIGRYGETDCPVHGAVDLADPVGIFRLDSPVLRVVLQCVADRIRASFGSCLKMGVSRYFDDRFRLRLRLLRTCAKAG